MPTIYFREHSNNCFLHIVPIFRFETLNQWICPSPVSWRLWMQLRLPWGCAPPNTHTLCGKVSGTKVQCSYLASRPSHSGMSHSCRSVDQQQTWGRLGCLLSQLTDDYDDHRDIIKLTELCNTIQSHIKVKICNTQFMFLMKVMLLIIYYNIIIII